MVLVLLILPDLSPIVLCQSIYRYVGGDAAFTGSTGDHGTDLFTDLAGRVCRIWHTKWERAGTAGIFLHSLICVREPGMLYL